MSDTRSSYKFLTVVLLVVAAYFVGTLDRTGRYKVTGTGNASVVVCDSHTGKVWSGRASSSALYYIGAPAEAKVWTNPND